MCGCAESWIGVGLQKAEMSACPQDAGTLFQPSSSASIEQPTRALPLVAATDVGGCATGNRRWPVWRIAARQFIEAVLLHIAINRGLQFLR